MRTPLTVLLLVLAAAPAHAATPPVCLWLEAEWFDGVEGSFAYWTGTAKPTGAPLRGEVMFQVNRTKDGWLVLLVNNSGVDKTQNGVARVGRRAFVDVLVRTALPAQSAREVTGDRDLTPEKGKEGTVVRVRVQPGNVQAAYFTVMRE